MGKDNGFPSDPYPIAAAFIAQAESLIAATQHHIISNYQAILGCRQVIRDIESSISQVVTLAEGETMPQRVAAIHHDVTVLGLLVSVLDVDGYQSIVRSTVEEGYRMIREEQPDAVILDLQLESPFPSWTVAETLRHDPATQHIPLLVMATTPAPWDQIPESCQQNCATLTEPFDVATLLGKLNALLTSSTRD